MKIKICLPKIKLKSEKINGSYAQPNNLIEITCGKSKYAHVEQTNKLIILISLLSFKHFHHLLVHQQPVLLLVMSQLI